MMSAVGLDPAMLIALRAALALLFAWAAFHKLRDVASFQEAVSNYELVPRRVTTIFAAGVIAAELSLAVSLPFAGGSGPALGAAVLLATYTAAIVINLARGRVIDCGCSGPARRRPVSGALIARNCLVLLVALSAALPPSSRSFAWIDVVTIIGSVVFLSLLYGVIDQVAANSADLAVLHGAGGGQALRPPSPQAQAAAIGGAVQ